MTSCQTKKSLCVWFLHIFFTLLCLWLILKWVVQVSFWLFYNKETVSGLTLANIFYLFQLCIFSKFAEQISPSFNHILLLILSFLLYINSLFFINLACLNPFPSPENSIVAGVLFIVKEAPYISSSQVKMFRRFMFL